MSTSTVTYGFGIGGIFAIPTVAVPTPIRFGTVKNVTLDIKTSEKDLNGQGQVTQAIGIGAQKISGKIEEAEIDANRFNQLFFGVTQNVGQITTALDEPGVVPTTPFAITVVHASFFVRDLGVIDQTTAQLLTRVTSGPTTGQYSEASGVYTFAAADAARTLFISYDYTIAATGANFNPINPLMGVRPTFALKLTNPFQGNVLDLYLPNCITVGLALDFKNEDFNWPKIDFRAFAGSDGKFLQWSTNNAQTGSRT